MQKAIFLYLSLSAILWARENQLDDLYSKRYGSVQTASPCTQLRRLSIQLKGTIPAYQEALNCATFDRKSAARQYLRSADFAGQQAARMGGLLREKTRMDGAPYGGYFKYISQSIHENKSYDRFVYELLTARGSADKNGAVHFYLRDDSDPLEIAEYVGRAFYGRRYSCARCHDHPSMDFSRRDYYGFSAFFSQTWIKRGKEDMLPASRREHMTRPDQEAFRKQEQEWRTSVWNKLSESEKKQWRESNRLAFKEVVFEPALSLRFPYSDAAPGGDLVKPRLPDGSRLLLDEKEDRRVAFARWLTDRKNDRFRKVFINRIWTQLMGWSFFTPLDDWDSKAPLEAGEILEHLDQVFLAQGQKPKDLIFYIVSSNAWARQPIGPDGPRTAARFSPRRLEAGELFNSVLLLSGTPMGNPYERALATPPEATLTGQGALLLPQEKQNTFQNSCQIPRPVNQGTFLAIFGAGDRNDIDDDVKETNMAQILTLRNGNTTRQIINQMVKKESPLFAEHARGGMQSVFNHLYLQILTRPMNAKENETWQKLSQPLIPRRPADFDRAAAEDLIWSLLQSPEFLYVY
ncbi:MAG: DUF1553 domain-containing protein [Spirochaetales bacterium]|nr:DUF1553 domain-containing protein [Spirochaetales bacterium]